jgi:hypothetical protein
MKRLKIIIFLLSLLICCILTALELIIPDHHPHRRANIQLSASSGYVWKVKRVVNRHELVVTDQFNSTFRISVRSTLGYKKGDLLTGK